MLLFDLLIATSLDKAEFISKIGGSKYVKIRQLEDRKGKVFGPSSKEVIQ